MSPETLEKICAVYRKYHLTHAQCLQLQNIIITVTGGQSVMLYTPREAGKNTLEKAAQEIIELLNKDIKTKAQ